MVLESGLMGVFRCFLMAGVILSMLSGSVDATDFRLRISGMVGFVPDDGGLDVILINEFDENYDPDPTKAVTHFPQLEVLCDDIVSDTDGSDCIYWPPDEEAKRRIIALDRQGDGVELRIKIGDADQTGSVEPSKRFNRQVISLKALAGGDPTRAKLRDEAKAPGTMARHLLGRVRLQGGSIDSEEGDTGGWKFKENPGGKVVKPYPEIARSSTWSIPYKPAKDVVVEFWPFGAKKADRVLKLRNANGVKITLSNEPDVMEFCQNVPKKLDEPFRHYIGFYDLTEFAKSNDLSDLPLPYPDNPEKLCSWVGIAGRRVDCVQTLYDGS